MYNICIHCKVVDLCVSKKKKKKEWKKEEKERRGTKLKFLSRVFSTLLKASSTYTVELAIEQQSDVVSKLLHSSPLFPPGAGHTHVPYVQVAILNLPHLYLKGTTVHLDYLLMFRAVVPHPSPRYCADCKCRSCMIYKRNPSTQWIKFFSC